MNEVGNPLVSLIETFATQARQTDGDNYGTLMIPFLFAYVGKNICFIPIEDYKLINGRARDRFNQSVAKLTKDDFPPTANVDEEGAITYSPMTYGESRKVILANTIYGDPVTLIPTNEGFKEEKIVEGKRTFELLTPARLLSLANANIQAMCHTRKDINKLGEQLGITDYYELEKLALAILGFNQAASEQEAVLENKSKPTASIDVRNILEAGVILTEAPPEIIEKYHVGIKDKEVRPESIQNPIVKDAVEKVLKVLNAGPKEKVSVLNTRLVANLIDYILYNPSEKRWFYKGGFSENQFAGGNMSNQVTPILKGFAHCWTENPREKEKQPFSYSRTITFYEPNSPPSDEPGSVCEGCLYVNSCQEHEDHIGYKAPVVVVENTEMNANLRNTIQDYLDLLHGILYEKIQKGLIVLYLPKLHMILESSVAHIHQKKDIPEPLSSPALVEPTFVTPVIEEPVKAPKARTFTTEGSAPVSANKPAKIIGGGDGDNDFVIPVEPKPVPETRRVARQQQVQQNPAAAEPVQSNIDTRKEPSNLPVVDMDPEKPPRRQTTNTNASFNRVQQQQARPATRPVQTSAPKPQSQPQPVRQQRVQQAPPPVTPDSNKGSGRIKETVKSGWEKLLDAFQDPPPKQEDLSAYGFGPDTHEVLNFNINQGNGRDFIGGIGDFAVNLGGRRKQTLSEVDLTKLPPNHPLARKLNGIRSNGGQVDVVYMAEDGVFRIVIQKTKNQKPKRQKQTGSASERRPFNIVGGTTDDEEEF